MLRVALSDLPSAPDAVVVAIPAPGVPAIIEEAGAIGSGGAVVYAAGFGESPAGAGLERALTEAARRYSLPVCGPNCDGLVSLWSRAALWGDALAAPEPGHVALVSQSGNLVVNALATRRGLRLHTAVSSGNEAVVTTPDWVEHLAREPEVRSIALLVEAEGDGARLCEALAVCADEGVGVAVLKVGASERGRGRRGGAHRRRGRRPSRVPRADGGGRRRVGGRRARAARAGEGAGRPRTRGRAAAGSRSSPARAATPGSAPTRPTGSASTCRRCRPPRSTRCASGCRTAATVANPLDYTAMIWGEVETLRDLVRTVGEDPAIGHVLVFYDRPPGIAGHAAESWDAVEEGILAGAAVSPVPVMVAATLPELLDDEAAWRFCSAGVPAIAGLRTGVAVAAALAAPPGDARRLREIAALAGAATRRRPLARGARGEGAPSCARRARRSLDGLH